MTSVELRRLIEGGETLTVEFKRARSSDDLNDDDIVHSVACLANADGGTLVLGVEDDGTVSGCAPRRGDAIVPAHLAAMISNRTDPPLVPDVAVVEIDGKAVVVIHVARSAQPVGTHRGTFVRRRIREDGTPECRAMTARDIQAATFASGEIDWATMPAPRVTLEDIDLREVERYRNQLRLRDERSILASQSVDQLLQSLDLARLTSTGDLDICVGAVLMFGHQAAIKRILPNHEVQFQVLDGTQIRRSKVFVSPLLLVIDELDKLLTASIEQEEVDIGLFRVPMPTVPPRAVREAIINALVHRDYFERGSVRIELSRDTFTVESPGGLPRGVTTENILDTSVPRSRTLCNALMRVALAERAGSGVNIMFEELLSRGHPEPSYGRTDDYRVVVDFAVGNADKAIATYMRQRAQRGDTELALHDLLILRIVKENGDVSLKELEATLGARIAAPLSTLMARMVEQGVIEARGDGRGRRYHLGPDFYSTIGESFAYENIRRPDSSQLRELVISHIRQQGSVQRGDIARLCHISPTEARSILRSMVDDKILRLEGEKRAARYFLSD